MKAISKTALLLGSAALIQMVPSTQAMAQDAAGTVESTPKGTMSEPEAIIVSGTRITREGFEAPTPTTVIDEKALQANPQPNIANYLNQLPALSGSVSPRTSGTGVGGGTQGANLLNLRNLGINRTLVLLDRRRVVASATTGAVDVNLLPTALLSRVDIVTGGASAAWGSDAVAGVVNLVLNTEYTGIKGQALTGISTYGDAPEYKAELSAGTSFAGGRGHIVVSGTYFNIDSVDRADSRSWYDGRKFMSNPAFVAGGSQPRYIIAAGNAAQATPYGVITQGPLRGTLFLGNNQTGLFDFGQIGGQILSINGTPNDLGADTQLQGSVEQYSLFGHASYELTDSLKVYAEMSYGRTTADTHSVPYLRYNNITIQRDNAYLPDNVRTAMANANPALNSFVMGRTNLDLGYAEPHNVRQLYRYVAGADLDLGGGWKASAYYEHGLSKVLNAVNNDAIKANYDKAVDAVVVTSANQGASGLAIGSIACRSTLTSPGNGCVPFNVFGPQTITSAQSAYLLGTAVQNIRLTQDVAALSIDGDLFSLPAGPVSLASGVEYRRENHSATADAMSIANGFWVGNYKPSNGGYNVKEGFAEIAVPILKDSSLGQSLDLNAAVRFTDYSTSGWVTTWKAGLVYDIAAGFKLRGTLSRDIRAPNLNEYFLGGQSTSQQVRDPANNNLNFQILRIQSGNVDLSPEVSDTRTFGVVFQPDYIRGLSLSVDYYRIKIKDAIGTLTNQQLVDRCYGGNAALCNFIARDSANQIVSLSIKPVNFQQEVMSGIDLEGSYRFGLGNGNVTLRSLWNYTDEHYINDGQIVDDLIGEVGQAFGPTHWRGLNSVTFDNDSVNLSFRHRYIGSGVIDAAYTAADIADNHVPAVSYFDASATAKVKTGGAQMELFLSVDNMFNKAPPISPTTQNQLQTSNGRAAGTYDLIGRFFRAGVRISM